MGLIYLHVFLLRKTQHNMALSMLPTKFETHNKGTRTMWYVSVALEYITDDQHSSNVINFHRLLLHNVNMVLQMSQNRRHCQIKTK